jgi:hypothetical protein
VSLKQPTVDPGEVGTFEFSITTPVAIGDYKEHFLPVAEGISWMNDIGQHWELGTKNPTYRWQFISQSIQINSS